MDKKIALIVLIVLIVPFGPMGTMDHWSTGPVDKIYLLEQDADRRAHPEFVTLITDARVRSTLEEKGLAYRLIDRESTLPGVQWPDELPAIQLLSGDNIIYEGSASALTFDALIALIERHQEGTP